MLQSVLSRIIVSSAGDETEIAKTAIVGSKLLTKQTNPKANLRPR